MKKQIRMVQRMPDLPQPYEMRDWRQVALDFDRLVFDENIAGDFLPMIWMDEANDSFGLPSYVCASDKHKGTRHEGITCMAAVVGATLAGVDKAGAARDYVSMCQCYFSEADGIVLNLPGGKSGGSIWYDCYSSILFNMLALLYPGHGRLDEIRKTCADRFTEAINQLSGHGSYTGNYNFTGYDFRNMRPMPNGRWLEPEGAAGMAWIAGVAHRIYGEEKYLSAARQALQFLEELKMNPQYEILMPFGAVMAARLNAWQGDQWDVDKLINWCFDTTSYSRHGWGVIDQRWGDYDCHGLCGSHTDHGLRYGPDIPQAVRQAHGGYAFVTNTYSMLGAILPLCKYDKAYAADLGKYALNALNASRLFYPGAHDAKHQSCGFWHGDPYNCMAYEGLRRRWDGQEPYATGDPIRYAWDAIDIGLYGSAHVGILGALAEKTEIEGILRLNLNATDFAGDNDLPTYLYYNPYAEEKHLSLEWAAGSAVYDVLSGQAAEGQLTLPPGGAALIRLLAQDGRKLHQEGNLLKYGEAIVDYQYQ